MLRIIPESDDVRHVLIGGTDSVAVTCCKRVHERKLTTLPKIVQGIDHFETKGGRVPAIVCLPQLCEVCVGNDGRKSFNQICALAAHGKLVRSEQFFEMLNGHVIDEGAEREGIA